MTGTEGIKTDTHFIVIHSHTNIGHSGQVLPTGTGAGTGGTVVSVYICLLPVIAMPCVSERPGCPGACHMREGNEVFSVLRASQP